MSQILNAADARAAVAKARKTKDVEVAGVGTFRLAALSAGAAIELQARMRGMTGENEAEFGFLLIARSWIDEDGNPLLPEAEGIEFARELDQESAGALLETALVLNGFTQDAIDAAKKNSRPNPPGSTRTTSRKSSGTRTST